MAKPTRVVDRKILFIEQAFEEYNQWAIKDMEAFKKIASMIKEIRRTPFSGIGKPEALKYDLKGFWSRRITGGDRLVYSVTDEHVYIISCKYHYGDK